MGSEVSLMMADVKKTRQHPADGAKTESFLCFPIRF